MLGRVARLGIGLPLGGIPLPEQRAAVGACLAAGYTDVWTRETAGLDPFAALASVAAVAADAGAAPDARLGVAVAGVFNRGPGLLAMQAATLAELAPGRFVLGVGSSSRPVVEGWNAAAFARPVERVRDTLRFLRRALAGEKVTEDYETFSVQGFQLERPPQRPPPLYAAALGPRMLAMAGAEADGVCLSLVAPEDLPPILAALGAAGSVADVVLRLPVWPGEDAGRARAAARRMLAAYLNVPVYRRFQRWLGRGATLEPVWDAWRRGDRARAEAALPDALVDALFVHGPVDACRRRIAQYVEAGVTTPVVAVWPSGGVGGVGGDPLEAARALAGSSPGAAH
jgi:probable F420-dependent oxidoreductase